MVALDLDFVFRMAVALGIGGLVGIEREHGREDQLVVAGVRTFPLIALSGFLLSWVALLSSDPLVGGLLIAVGFLTFGAVALSLFLIRSWRGVAGLTTPVAVVVVFLAGVLVGQAYLFEGVLVGLATTFLLVTKRRLHAVAQVLSDREILAALELLTVAVILLPLSLDFVAPAPYEDYFGRGRIIDPFWTLLIVLVISAISFGSFIVIRQIGGQRGVRFAGAFGGLANSEAATASLVELAKANPPLIGAATGGILVANGTMLVRNLIVAVLADPTLQVASLVVLPLLGLSVLSAVLVRNERQGEALPSSPKLQMASPFALWPAFKFAAIFTLVSAAAYLVEAYLGEGGALVTAVGGFVSSAAVTGSVAALVFTGHLNVWVAALTILLASTLSTLNKLLIAQIGFRAVAERLRRYVIVLVGVGLAACAAIAGLSLNLA